MKITDFYTEAHLMVAAIRILQHRNTIPPSIEDISKLTSFSLEQAGILCRRLIELNIIEMTEGGFGTKLFVKNHLAIEDIPVEKKENRLDEELRKFKNSKSGISQKIESIKAEQQKKQQDLFAAIEKKFKKESAGNKGGDLT